VEWSENVREALEDPVIVRIEKLGDETRRITLEGGDFLAAVSL
jgi:hypothetical protein